MNFNDFEYIYNETVEKYDELLGTYINDCKGDENELKNYLYTFINNNDDIEIDFEQFFINTLNSRIYNNEIKEVPSEEYDNKTLLQIYFKDVGYIYDSNDNNTNIPFTLEDRDKIIEMNLKCVIKIAKAYRGMGLSLEELISAGNEGLVVAFDKYNPDRNKHRENLLNTIKTKDGDFNIGWVEENIKPFCSYGKLKNKYEKFFIKDKYTQKELIKFVEKNIKEASFNSVAMMWVQAYIRSEISNCSRTIRKPLQEIKREREGLTKKETYLDINAPISDDGNNTLGDVLDIKDRQVTELDMEETHNTLHMILKKLFVGIKMRDKRIVMQRFGIGLPRAMQPQEISEREKISVARISQIIQLTLEKMRNNAEKYDIDFNDLHSSF